MATLPAGEQAPLSGQILGQYHIHRSVGRGKQYAGQHVLVDEIEPGVWMIKLGEFIPKNERWLHEPVARDRLDRAIRWAEEHPETSETDLDELGRRLAE